MNELTLVLMVVSIGLFLVRYVIRRPGVDFLCAVTSICACVLILQDDTITEVQFLPVLMPMILIIMLTMINLGYGTRNKF